MALGVPILKHIRVFDSFDFTSDAIAMVIFYLNTNILVSADLDTVCRSLI